MPKTMVEWGTWENWRRSQPHSSIKNTRFSKNGRQKVQFPSGNPAYDFIIHTGELMNCQIPRWGTLSARE